MAFSIFTHLVNSHVSTFNVTWEDNVDFIYVKMYHRDFKRYPFLTAFLRWCAQDICLLTIFIALTEECTDYVSKSSIGLRQDGFSDITYRIANAITNKILR